MIPQSFTAAQVQQLIDLGRARMHGAEHVTTARATYSWNVASQCFEWVDALPPRAPTPPVPPGPRPEAPRTCPVTPPPAVPLSLIMQRVALLLDIAGVLGIVGAFVWWANLYGTLPGAEPCLYSLSVNATCQGYAIAAALYGYVPYTPLALWGSVGVAMLGGLLRFCIRPPTP